MEQIPAQVNIGHISTALEKIALCTKNSPYENQIFLVGGAVRDYLLGKAHAQDFDLVLELDAIELAQFLYKKRVSEIAPVVYPRFGTALIRVMGSDIELVTARKESYRSKSRKPKVEKATLLEDAQRRDFTINTLLLNLHTGKIVDPLGVGISDLRRKILRTPLDPKETFYEDPLRMLRAIRFRWQVGCRPTTGMYDAIRKTAPRLKIISRERIRDELIKMLALNKADRCLKDLEKTHLLAEFMPEAVRMVGVTQGSYHHLDVWEHTLLTLKNATGVNLTVSLAALLHDIAKPQTRFIDENGHIRFFGHETEGAPLANQILRRLKFPKEIVDNVSLLVKNHMRLGIPILTDTALRRIIRDLGEQLPNLIELGQADSRAHKKGTTRFLRKQLEKRIDKLVNEVPRSKMKSPLSGKEIMEFFAIETGPEIGEYKKFLSELVVEGKLKPDDKIKAYKLLKSKFKDK